MLKPCFLSDEYLVSDEGFVLNKQQTKKLKPSINPKGYQMVNLLINGQRKGISVHILVARAFCDGYKKGLTVNHIDGNKLNNKATNLEWITNEDNIKHFYKNHNYCGVNNPNHKSIYAKNLITNEIIMFNSIMDAAKFIKPAATYKQLRSVQKCIIQVAKGKKKSYRNYLWNYEKISLQTT